MREVVIGLLGGVLIGATGAGTGSLITPLLILAGHSAAASVAIGVATLFASKLAGSLMHSQLGHWPGKNARFVIFGGVAGAIVVGAIVTISPSLIVNRTRLLVGATLLAGSFALTLASRRHDDEEKRSPANPALLFMTGFSVAPVVAITSAGSGSLLIALLLLFTSWRARELAAISNWFGLIVGAVASLIHWQLHTFDPHLFALVIGGVLPGVAAGVLLSRTISRQCLTYAVYLLTLSLGAALLA